jgi:hypothetical protein
MFLFALVASIAGVSRAQSSGALPQKWDESVHALAQDITAAASPSRAISLAVKNLSSLDSADATAIQQALESDLTHLGFHYDAASSAEVRVEVTLSESAEKYVWVAETHVNNAVRVAIVDVARPADNSTGKPADSLVLDRKLVWQQSGKFLDFAVFRGFDPADSALWILEPERVLIYRSAGDEWQLERMIAIAHRVPWPRDLRGAIDVQHSSILLPGLACVVRRAPANDLQCSTVPAGKNGSSTADSPQIKIEGRERDDTLALRSTCDGDSVVVATGTGDWTQPDLIQAYLEREGRAVSSGNPVQSDGPVTVLNWEAEGAARAVVHNLKTGNYEAYIVTATCGH